MQCPNECGRGFLSGPKPLTPASGHASPERSARAVIDPVLRNVLKLAHSTDPQSWTTLKLASYFGTQTQNLPFKDVLLPFIWIARQQLIERVGCAYQRLAIADRIDLEGELLATLDSLCQQALQAEQKMPAASTILDHVPQREAFQRQGVGFCLQHPALSRTLIDTLLSWVDSVEKLLDSLKSQS